jgi:23S rRNA pseudouridine1911/1915/1917 synthase
MNQYAKNRAQRSRAHSPEKERDEAPSAPPRAPPPAPLHEALELDLVADEQDVGRRLDLVLKARLEERGAPFSRTRLQALIEAGEARVDGAAVVDSGLRLRAGQSVTLRVPPPEAAEPQAESLPLDVLFEDAHLIVINKPAGLVVHPSAGHESGTLVNALIAYCGESLSGIGGVRRPGIVHRLDKDTSGVMTVAKTDAAHQGLAALFADHGRTLGLEREYVALVWGAPDRASGIVDAPIGRHPHLRDRQAVARSGGREAVTHWRRERVFTDASGAPLAAFLRCRLETGRTHQIRVHLASLAHPVMGDPLYGAGFKTRASRLSVGANEALGALGRQALHAEMLAFPHPITGEDLAFRAAPPPDMARLIDALATPSRG